MKNAFEYEAELAALREELAQYEQRDADLVKAMTAMEQHLADAERRNAELQKAVDQSIEWFERMSSADSSGHSDLALAIRRMIAIKPTESGASE